MASIFIKCVLIASFTSSLFACRIWGIIAKSDGDFSTLSSREKAVVTEELQRLYEQSAYHPAGWALLGLKSAFENPVGLLVRSPEPANQNSEQYWNAVSNLLSDRGTTMGIGHVRMATSGINSIPNPHPWLFESGGITFALAHNGTVSKSILYDLITDEGFDESWLIKHPPQTFGSGSWQGAGWHSVVDSELILLLIMKRISEKGDILSGLKSAFKSLLSRNVSPYATNIVFSDGKSIYVYGGQNRLSFAESTEHFAVMSGPPNSGEAARLNWDGIKNSELVVIKKDGLKRFPNFTKGEPAVTVKKIKPKVYPAFPNPFNSSVSIQIELPEEMTASYEIFSILGKSVYKGKLYTGGEPNHTIQWVPRDPEGRQLPSGSYFLRVSAGQDIFRQKFIFLK